MQVVTFNGDLLATSSRIARRHLRKRCPGSCISNGRERNAVYERCCSSCADSDRETASDRNPTIADVETQGDDIEYAEMATGRSYSQVTDIPYEYGEPLRIMCSIFYGCRVGSSCVRRVSYN
jgi:hypothetical protein